MVLVIDSLLISPIKFVLDKVAEAVDAELDDDTNLKEELLAAQMKLELGEISDQEFSAIETEVLARLREIREARGEGQGLSMGSKVVGADVSFDVDIPE
jgi:hypothetical protein